MSQMLKKKMVIPDVLVCEKCGKTFRAMNPRSRCKDCIIKDNLAKYGKKRHQEEMIKEAMFGGPNNVACQRRFVILNPDEDEEKWQE